ncbi:hypothetical protein WJS89_05250 [Sphingomicrobium sp. XHP0235]|uniref:hypothetical protein n=1 Tax=Sphingomicrobium aquimarinum TaxID=3133971 RepID=UPI0031FF3B2B
MSGTGNGFDGMPDDRMLARLAAFEAEKVSSELQCDYFGCDEQQLEKMRSKVSR